VKEGNTAGTKNECVTCRACNPSPIKNADEITKASSSSARAWEKLPQGTNRRTMVTTTKGTFELGAFFQTITSLSRGSRVRNMKDHLNHQKVWESILWADRGSIVADLRAGAESDE